MATLVFVQQNEVSGVLGYHDLVPKQWYHKLWFYPVAIVWFVTMLAYEYILRLKSR